jgi:hypothetical protein
MQFGNNWFQDEDKANNRPAVAYMQFGNHAVPGRQDDDKGNMT